MKKTVINTLFAVAIVGLVSAVAVAITWALSKNIGTKTNTFTNESDIAANLYEPWWDFKDKDGTNITPASVPNYPKTAIGLASTDTPVKGESLASGYTLGRKIPKNPMVHNDSDEKSEWLAMRVVYKLTFDNSKVYTTDTGTAHPSGTSTVLTVNYTNFSKIATVKLVSGNSLTGEFNTTDWTPMTNASFPAKEVFCYNSIVAADGSTTALFDVVEINSALTIDSGDTRCHIVGTDNTGIYLDSNGLPQIDIELQGFAVDATALSNATTDKTTAHNALVDLVLATCYPS